MNFVIKNLSKFVNLIKFFLFLKDNYRKMLHFFEINELIRKAPYMIKISFASLIKLKRSFFSFLLNHLTTKWWWALPITTSPMSLFLGSSSSSSYWNWSSKSHLPMVLNRDDEGWHCHDLKRANFTHLIDDLTSLV